MDNKHDPTIDDTPSRRELGLEELRCAAPPACEDKPLANTEFFSALAALDRLAQANSDDPAHAEPPAEVVMFEQDAA